MKEMLNAFKNVHILQLVLNYKRVIKLIKLEDFTTTPMISTTHFDHYISFTLTYLTSSWLLGQFFNPILLFIKVLSITADLKCHMIPKTE